MLAKFCAKIALQKLFIDAASLIDESGKWIERHVAVDFCCMLSRDQLQLKVKCFGEWQLADVVYVVSIHTFRLLLLIHFSIVSRHSIFSFPRYRLTSHVTTHFCPFDYTLSMLSSITNWLQCSLTKLDVKCLLGRGSIFFFVCFTHSRRLRKLPLLTVPFSRVFLHSPLNRRHQFIMRL